MKRHALLAFVAAASSVVKSLGAGLLAAALWSCAGPLQAASIGLTGASAMAVSATIVPDAGDVGKPAHIWVGALFQDVLYMRSGKTWTRYSSGPLPVAISGQTLFASTLVSVVEQMDISALAGLELYVGYGASEQDMRSAPGKLAKVYTVSAATPPVAANVAPIVVDAGPLGQAGGFNVPFVSVTICAPGSASNCQTIDHIDVDTGSTGLRIMSSVVPASLALPYERDAHGSPYGECVQFADGSYVWGSVRLADIRIAGEQALSVPIQIVGDPAVPAVPRGCTGIPSNTVQSFGANGILGVGYFREDCGTECAQNAANGQYYACPSTGCTGTTLSRAQQVAQPVALFSNDNNGVVIQLPAISAQGETAVSGALVFGIGTQANNGLGSAKVMTVDPYGYITTVYAGRSYIDSYIDSGSSVLFLPRGVGVPSCSRRDPVAPGFLCPAASLSLTAMNHGTNGTTDSVNFAVANASAMLGDLQLTAFNNLAAPNSDAQSFDWGLPFFFGRSVFTAIENASTPGGTGPYVAY